MKDTIYTIPVTEIFDEEYFCPFCALYKRLEEEEVSYAVGPAMMEPDYRALTNAKGFCQNHIIMLNALPKVLPLALVLKSRMNNLSEKLKMPALPEKAKKKDVKLIDEYISNLEKTADTCVICDRIESNTERYFKTFIDLINEKEEFFSKVKNSGGFCIPHYIKILTHAKKALNTKELKKILPGLDELQQKKFNKLKSDTEIFIDSFDYKNAGKPCSAPGDTVTKSSFLLNGEFTPQKKTLKDV